MDLQRRTITSTDGDIALGVTDVGEGPPVVLVHGFPELAYSWRHQLPALRGAGVRAIAYDQRGYGMSDKPNETERYGLEMLVGDLVGLLDALELEQATIVGHDWGSIVVWATAVLHPERVAKVVSLNVPYRGWFNAFPTIDFMREHMADTFGYVLGFQEEGRAEASFARDPDAWLRRIYQGVAADVDFLDPEEFAVYRDAFVAGGIRGPVSYYRNIDANVAFAEPYANAPITVPTLMVTAQYDPILPPTMIDGMGRWVADLEVAHVTGSGHWTQQEAPDQVNRILIDSLT